MITGWRRHKHPSSGANRSSDVAVTVHINAEFNQMAVNPRIEYFSSNLIPEYLQSVECSTTYTVLHFFVKCLPCRSNRSPPRLLLQMQVDEIIPTFSTSNIYIGHYLPTELTLPWPQSYEIFEVLLNISINNSIGLRGFLNFCMLIHTFLYWLARGIPLKASVP